MASFPENTNGLIQNRFLNHTNFDLYSIQIKIGMIQKLIIDKAICIIWKECHVQLYLSPFFNIIQYENKQEGHDGPLSLTWLSWSSSFKSEELTLRIGLIKYLTKASISKNHININEIWPVVLEKQIISFLYSIYKESQPRPLAAMFFQVSS